MLEFLRQPWPWYVAGPIIGLMVPALLLVVAKPLGVSKSLRHICAAAFPGRADYFKYDWKKQGGWNLVFVLGMVIGAAIARFLLGGGETVGVSEATYASLSNLGMADTSGFIPAELFSWSALGTFSGFVCLVVGGFLVGFGARYAGGCTSGHAITGLSTFQWPSLVAVIGFFVGGLITTYFILPLLL